MLPNLPIGRFTALHLTIAALFAVEAITQTTIDRLPALALMGVWLAIALFSEWTYRKQRHGGHAHE